MDQKVNKKQNRTPHSLYTKLKEALNAQKSYVRFEEKKLIKKRTSTMFQNRNEFPLSCSLNLNDAIQENQNNQHGLSLALNISKASVDIKSLMTPYQTRKSHETEKLSPKRQSYFELHKKKVPQSTKILSMKQQRIEKFFKPSKSRTEPVQNEESLTYSIILKSFNNSQNNGESQKSTLNHTQVTEKGNLTQKCSNCSYHSQERASMFFKNEEIKKNISIIEELKKAFDHKEKKTEFKHFPEVQVLNLSYFNENKKKIVNKINSRQGLTSLQKMKLLSSKKKFLQMQCPKCKSIQKQIDEQRKQNAVSNLITYPGSFQYFVYEYKPTGHSTTKSIKSHKVGIGQSTLFVKKNKLNQKSIKNHKMNDTTKSSSSQFQDFIMHNKIQMPQRPQTAAPAKTSHDVFHFRISHPCPTGQFNHQNSVNKIPNDQNFVKPWESSAVEVDNEF